MSKKVNDSAAEKILPGGVEKRFCSGQGGAEVRAEGGGESGKPTTITGYASIYGAMSEPMMTSRGTKFRERIMPGAFGDLTGADVLARYNHELILGRTKSGTLKLSTDDKGLRYEINPPSTAAAGHAVESIRRGDVDGSSFAFRALKDEWRMVDGQPVRNVTAVKLVDVGPVDRPAYTATSDPGAAVSLRGLGGDETIAEEAIAELRSNPEGVVEKRYYYDPGPSTLTSILRNGIDAARNQEDAATMILDRLAQQTAALTPQELQALDDCEDELERAAARVEAARAACEKLLPDDPDDQESENADKTPLLTARLKRRALLV